MSMASVKEKAMFAASVVIVIALVYYGQKKFGTLPLIGEALPGGQ